MKKIVMLMSVLLFNFYANAQTKWSVDPAHSQVMFTVSHLVISEVTGNFKNFDGSITASNADFTDAQVSFTIDVNSINTENEMRDTHLKSDDFFNAGKYAAMTFKGTKMRKVAANKYQLTGDLTIRDVTKTVTLDVKYSGTVVDGWGNTKAGFKITGVINRFDYNLKWNMLTEAGGATVGKDVELMVNLQLKKSTETN